MRTRILVTGGGGFIGSHFAARCVEMGQDVHVLVRPATPLHRLACVKDRITLHHADIGDAAALRACLDRARPQKVFHLAVQTRPSRHAAMSAPHSDAGNLSLLIRMLSDLPEPPAILVRTGSIAEYGPLATPFQEDQLETPHTPYASGLAAGTNYTRLLQPLLPFKVITARLALVYGPMQSENFLLPALIRCCLRNEPITVKRANDRRDLIYVDDVINALSLLGATPLPDEPIVNISTGVAPTMHEVAHLVLRATGADPSLINFADPPDDGSVNELRASPELARRMIGWAALTPLPQGIAKTVAYARKCCRIAA